MTTQNMPFTDATCRPDVRKHQSVAKALSAKWTTYKRWRARRRTEHILSGLSDRALKDIGLTASEIGSVVYGEPGDRLHRYDVYWVERLNKCPNVES